VLIIKRVNYNTLSLFSKLMNPTVSKLHFVIGPSGTHQRANYIAQYYDFNCKSILI